MDAEELSVLVDELDTRIERLRALYEQYFMGFERIPPHVVHKDVERRIWVLRREKIRNNGLRFRFQQLLQRYNTYTSYWQRICREIENGTYKRDVSRAKKRFGPMSKVDSPATTTAPKSPPSPESPASDASVDEFTFGVDVVLTDDLTVDAPDPLDSNWDVPPTSGQVSRSSSRLPLPRTAPSVAASRRERLTPLPPSRRAPALPTGPTGSATEASGERTPARSPAPASQAQTVPDSQGQAHGVAQGVAQGVDGERSKGPGVSSGRIPSRTTLDESPGQSREEFRKVYAQYVDARRKNGESTAGLTYETLARNLRETSDRIKAKGGVTKLDFEVVTKNGKTILKPVAR